MRLRETETMHLFHDGARTGCMDCDERKTIRALALMLRCELCAIGKCKTCAGRKQRIGAELCERHFDKVEREAIKWANT